MAGISQMRWRTFLLYNAFGGIIWATAAVLVGYFLGSSLGLVERWLERATLLLALLAAVAVGFYLAYRWVAATVPCSWGTQKLCQPIPRWPACGRATTPSYAGSSDA